MVTDDTRTRSLLSVRVVIEGLAVLGIAWLASSVQAQNTAITTLQTQITQVQASLADVPALTRQMAAMQVQVAEHDRRLGRLEDGTPVKGWTK
jgi:Tfp pilus assembly protein PilN